MYFSKRNASTTGGTMAITPAALTNEKLVVEVHHETRSTIGSVCASIFWVRMRAKINSFQLVRKANMSEAISAGTDSGR